MAVLLSAGSISRRRLAQTVLFLWLAASTPAVMLLSGTVHGSTISSTTSPTSRLASILAMFSAEANEISALPQVYASAPLQSLPSPKVTVDAFTPSITLGDSVTITIRGVNQGASATEGDMQIAFPFIKDANTIQASSDLYEVDRASAGDLVYHDYGQPKNLKASYAYVAAVSAPWNIGSSHWLNVTVTPLSTGSFTFEVKLTMAYGNYAGWVSDPVLGSGVKDQQNEWAHTYSLTVNPPPLNPVPRLTVDAFPPSVTAGTQVTLTVHGSNSGGTATEGDLQLSFPQLTLQGDDKKVSPSSDLGVVAGGVGTAVHHDYGSSDTIPAQYVFVEAEAVQSTWKSGNSHYLSVTLTLNTLGDFTFNAKLLMAYGNYAGWVSDPQRGAGVRDQQNEWAVQNTIHVTPIPPPSPQITRVDYPQSVTAGIPFTITITGVNNGANANEGDLQIAFPSITDANTIQHSSDLSQVDSASAGDYVYHDYGQPKNIKASYAYVAAVSAPWSGGTQHYLSVTVTAASAGGFKFQVKLPMSYSGGWVSDPARSSNNPQDQQNEWVYSYSITVNPPSQPPAPQIIRVDYPQSATAGIPFTITVTGVNNGGSADEGDLQLGFPQIGDANTIQASSDLSVIDRASAGDLVYHDYGQPKNLQASYAFVAAVSAPWSGGSQHYLSATVTSGAGDFVFQVKLPMSYNGGQWVSDPAQNSNNPHDQQNERVYQYTVHVTPSSGGLIVTVENTNGNLASSMSGTTTVCLYTSDYKSTIGCKQTDKNSQASWDGLAARDYLTEAYHNPQTGLAKDEFWGTLYATVNAGQTATYTLKRHAPVFSSISCAATDSSTAQCTATTQSGDQTTVQVEVIVDRDQTSPYDGDQTSSTQPAATTVTLQYGGLSPGAYQFYGVLYSNYNKKFTPTDQWAWSPGFTLANQPKTLYAQIGAKTKTVSSGGTVPLYAMVTASDNSYPPISYRWDAACGTFDSATSQTPTWTAPQVSGQQTCNLTLTASAQGYTDGTASVDMTVVLLALQATLSASRPSVNPGGTVTLTLTVTATDGSSPPLTYQWSADGGTFSSTSANPTDWTAPSPAAQTQYTATVTVTSPGYQSATAAAKIIVTEKPPTSLTLSAEPKLVESPGTVTISGAITPAMEVGVTITLTKPDKTTITLSLRTRQDGTYSYPLPVSDEGDWSVQASWNGDSQYAPSTSDAATFTVQRAYASSYLYDFTIDPGTIEAGASLNFHIAAGNKGTADTNIWFMGIVFSPSAKGETWLNSAVDGPHTVPAGGSYKSYLSVAISPDAPVGDYVAVAALFDGNPIDPQHQLLARWGRYFTVGGSSFIQISGKPGDRLIHIHIEGNDKYRLMQIGNGVFPCGGTAKMPQVCTTLNAVYAILKANGVISGRIEDELPQIQTSYTIPIPNDGPLDIMIGQTGPLGRIYLASMDGFLTEVWKDFGEMALEKDMNLICDGLGDLLGIINAYREKGMGAAFIQAVIGTKEWAGLIQDIAQLAVREVVIVQGMLDFDVPSVHYFELLPPLQVTQLRPSDKEVDPLAIGAPISIKVSDENGAPVIGGEAYWTVMPDIILIDTPQAHDVLSEEGNGIYTGGVSPLNPGVYIYTVTVAKTNVGIKFVNVFVTVIDIPAPFMASTPFSSAIVNTPKNATTQQTPQTASSGGATVNANSKPDQLSVQVASKDPALVSINLQPQSMQISSPDQIQVTVDGTPLAKSDSASSMLSFPNQPAYYATQSSNGQMQLMVLVPGGGQHTISITKAQPKPSVPWTLIALALAIAAIAAAFSLATLRRRRRGSTGKPKKVEAPGAVLTLPKIIEIESAPPQIMSIEDAEPKIVSIKAEEPK